jgi:hypothetical protein
MTPIEQMVAVADQLRKLPCDFAFLGGEPQRRVFSRGHPPQKTDKMDCSKTVVKNDAKEGHPEGKQKP